MKRRSFHEGLLRSLSQGLEAIEEPFASLAAAAGVEQEEWLEQVKRLVAAGVIRRFGAILNHYAAGINANVMVVWRVDEGEVERVGDIIASFPAVTHCYERPALPDFPYNLYSMIHGSSWEECQATIREISERTGVADYLPLRTIREFKKSSVRLASEAGEGEGSPPR